MNMRNPLGPKKKNHIFIITAIVLILIILALLASNTIQQSTHFKKQITNYQKLIEECRISNIRPLPDTDNDGLPNKIEKIFGTNENIADTDGDSLSDYYEIKKYKTNPLKKDSDNDGVEDQDWEERREYTYTIQAIVDLRPPFNIEQMNDFYQDARILQKQKNNITRIEVILYPEAKTIITPAYYKPIKNENTKKTYTKNYSDEMQKKVQESVKDSKTDVQVVLKILKDIENMSFFETYLPVSVYRNNDGEIIDVPVFVPAESKKTNLSIDEIKERMFFADSMYELRTHGGCGSVSTLRGAMFRSAGLPEKIINVIPLNFHYPSDNTTTRLKEKYKPTIWTDNITEGSAWLVSHYFNLVLIGNQWVRVDKKIGPGIRVYDNGPYIKIREIEDITDYNSDKYYTANPKVFFEYRPYKYLSVIEQEATHI